MNLLRALSLASVFVFLTSCTSTTVPLSELSKPELNLLLAVNAHRSSLGQKALVPTVNLTALARRDAVRRVTSGEQYVDNRQATGYERMLTLSGRARAGDQFGDSLMAVWQRQPLQREWLNGSYSGVGVGTATGASGVQTAVLLLGGFSGAGI